MTDPATILQIIGSAIGLVRQIKQVEGAERAFEELEKLTAIMKAVSSGVMSSLDVEQARKEIDRLVVKLMRHEELQKGEADVDAALAKKFAKEDDR